jgi:hypothetical protein
MKNIIDEIKQQIPKLVGNEVKKLIRENIDNYDNEALDFAGKTIETEIEKTLGLPSSIGSLENKSGFNYKISGTEKTIASILKGESVSDAVKNNISVSVGINILF